MLYEYTYKYHYKDSNGKFQHLSGKSKVECSSVQEVIEEIVDDRLSEGQINDWVIFVTDIVIKPVGRARVE